ncbi:sugar transferase [Bacteriovorax sp. PP10]|uniref:Sugar transferase n=1 Tax=Bacteriovorax antarcticus TaxID=3088717 RepID=A0ABU5VUD2_9BACT|nr:sugar transferase [Bacteriovorax sp. PP10]MEA9356644.1 sugar transferase [Bacteriovorax sp. PP10]
MAIRVFNVFLSLIAMLFLSIPFCIVWILVKITSPGPAIHWSKRIGQKNEIFLMPKFRTMRINTPQLATHLLGDGKSYLTPIGSFLRKSSLDELPQLWSVLKGDMSLVGPRPALFNQDDLKELRTKYNIHTLAPGVTGWAQINGRDELSIEEKVKFDKQYLDQQSLWFDIKIIFLTAYKVIKRANIQH